MKILHTADWHLGTSLEGVSRKEEQQQILNEIITAAENRKVDLVLVAGDVFCGINTPAYADQMFANAILKMCDNGNRAVVVIGGNNDDTERFVALKNFAISQNIYILNALDSDFDESVIKKDGRISLCDYGKGYLTFEKDGEKVVVAYMPYIANFFNVERTCGDENAIEKTRRLFEMAARGFRSNSFNIALTHCFVPYKNVTRDFYFEHDRSIFPQNASYVALGHVHDYVEVDEKKNIIYPGSTIQIFENENKNKYFIILNTENGKLINKELIKIRSCKKIEKVVADDFADAREKLIKLDNCYVKVSVKQETITADEIKKIREEFPFVVSFVVLPKPIRKQTENLIKKQLNEDEVFLEFYKKTYGKLPDESLKKIYSEIISEK